MQCKNHDDREGLTVCSVCNEHFCNECIDTETLVCASCKEKQALSNDILEDIMSTVEIPAHAKVNFDPTDILTQIENEIAIQQQIEKIDFDINNELGDTIIEEISVSENQLGDTVIEEISVSENALGDTIIEEISVSENTLGDTVIEEISISENTLGDTVIEEISVSENQLSDTIVEQIIVSENEVTDNVIEQISITENALDDTAVEQISVSENIVTESTLDDGLGKVDLNKNTTSDTPKQSKTSSFKEKFFGKKDDIIDKTQSLDEDITNSANNLAESTKKQANKIAENANELKEKTKENASELKEKAKVNLKKTQENINNSLNPEPDEELEEIINKIEGTNKNGEYDHLLSRFSSHYGQGAKEASSSNVNDESNSALPLRINSILYFLSSLIPGGAQLYLGLTKRGATILIISAVFLFIAQSTSLFIIATILSFADAQKLRNIYYRGGKIEDTNDDVMGLIKNGYVILIIIAAMIAGV